MRKKREHQLQKRGALENFEAQYKKATIPMIILTILSEREMYTYEMVEEVRERSNGTYKMPLLYTNISKLQEDGYVEESRKEISEKNRVRIYYRTTPAGIAHLEKLKASYRTLRDTVRTIVFDEGSQHE